MYASMFSLDLGSRATSQDRARRGRSLAAALAVLPGFVAFIAIEAQDGSVTGLGICVDAQALEIALQKVVDWQSEQSGHPHFHEKPIPSIQAQNSAPGFAIELLAAGEVIVQRGF